MPHRRHAYHKLPLVLRYPTHYGVGSEQPGNNTIFGVKVGSIPLFSVKFSGNYFFCLRRPEMNFNTLNEYKRYYEDEIAHMLENYLD